MSAAAQVPQPSYVPAAGRGRTSRVHRHADHVLAELTAPSTPTAPTTPAARVVPATPVAPVRRPTVRLVRAAAPARSAVPGLIAVVLLLAVALVASMLLNAAMADTAFKMHKAQIELSTVEDHIDTVRTELQRASAPDALAQRASELGMVPAGAPGVVDLSTGTTTPGQRATEQPAKPAGATSHSGAASRTSQTSQSGGSAQQGQSGGAG